jgi:intraflagellar transport protein 122
MHVNFLAMNSLCIKAHHRACSVLLLRFYCPTSPHTAFSTIQSHRLIIQTLLLLHISSVQSSAITCIDMSLYRTFLSFVNAQNILTVIDLKTQEAVFTKSSVSSVCFNSEVNNMLCYTNAPSSSSTPFSTSSSSRSHDSSSDSAMYVVSGIGLRKIPDGAPGRNGMGSQQQYTPPLEQLQHISGPAIGFQAQKIYLLHRGSIAGADVPHSDNMRRALDVGDILSAYSVACLGATEADWKLLAVTALRVNSLSIAKNCFARLRDTKYLSFIEAIERGEVNNSATEGSVNSTGSAGGGSVAAGAGTGDKRGSGRVRGVEAVPTPLPVPQAPLRAQTLDPTWQAELLAYEGHHQEAAKTFSRAGKVDEAIRMLTDLRRWDDAKLFAQNAGQSDHSGLTMRQAKWLQEINDWKGTDEQSN